MMLPSTRRLLGAVLFIALALGGAASALPVLVAVAGTGLAWSAVRWSRQRRARRHAERGAVVLGRDRSGRAVTVTNRQLEAHALIVGASGAGKTTTIQTILAQQIADGRPVVAIDMKGSPGFAAQLQASARAAGRGLRVFTPEGPTHYNPLAHGGPTALKDLLMSAERFSEPHYQRAAERYLQTALTVLDAVGPGRPPSLSEVVDAMRPARLAALARRAPAPLATRVADYVGSLTPDQASAAAGLGTRLALLHESVAGRWLEPSPDQIDVGAALDGGDVVLFSLNSSTYGKLAAQLGALAIQDLTSAAGRRLAHSADRPGGPTRALVVLEEFSGLGADNVLALLARGREAGVSVALSTQELADLDRAAPGFRDQVLGNTALKLVHRQEVESSARVLSGLAGTEPGWREVRSIPAFGGRGRRTSRGSRQEIEVPVVHPNELKRLSTGQLVLLSNVPEPRVARTTVRRAEPDARPRRRGPARRQAPGVTR